MYKLSIIGKWRRNFSYI